MADQITKDTTGMLLIVSRLGTAIGMGPSVDTRHAASDIVGDYPCQRFGHAVDTAHGGDDPDLIADAHTAQAIHVGDWVHSHNLATSLNEEAVTGNPASWAKYCPDCAARVHRRQKTESERKRRPCVDS